ncbi:hypothetical protein V3528_21525, partial [Acinetobacter johnsonii]|uniref:hypothetical protein n=1 Tax=Acinetobacter johnsonii TaxID=40214 RepID=UPI0030F64870
MAGYKLSQYDPPIPYSTIKTIHPGLSIKPTSKDIHPSSLSPMLRLNLASEHLKKSITHRKSSKRAKPSV